VFQTISLIVHSEVPSLQNPYTDSPAQASKKFNEGRELDISTAFFNTGDETLLGSDSVGQLFLDKTGAEPLFFELLPDNEGIALHLALIPLRRSNRAEILGNEVFDWGQVILKAVHLFLYKY
jgi:hypothetical protein